MKVDQLPRHSFAVRYLVLFGGETFSKLCVMAAFAYLARVYPPAQYGQIEVALAATMFFVMSVEGGMGLYGARIVAASPDRLPVIVPQIMTLRLLIGLPAFLLMMLVGIRSQTAGMAMLQVTSAAVFLTPFLTQWVFQGLRQMHWVAAGTALRNFTFVAIVVLFIRQGSDLRLVGLAEVGGIAALAFFNTAILFGIFRLRVAGRGAVEGARRVLSDVWFMGVGDFAWACLWYAPAIVLDWLGRHDPAEVAWISAPVRVVVALHTFVFLYFFNLLPNLAVEIAAGVEAWRTLVVRSLRASTWPALLLAACGAIVAPVAIPLVFGESYSSAVRQFQIVIWVIPLTWFSGHFRFSLIAAGQQRREFLISVATAVVTASGAAVLGWQWGSLGAASALLLGGIANTVIAVLVARATLGSVPLLTSLAPDWGAWRGLLAGRRRGPGADRT